ncbi:hypothetical protein ACH5RR_027021 [Cinchona calisaya]|uniref:Protein odr-4 homolog n=1 Tax=Cinchona calisaya TaxID=153742 RepID=A0ABD2Z4A4_9GENT
MVKAVVGEESRLKLVEDRLSRAALPSQVGLVIGKLSKSLDKAFVFDLIPTPLNDSGEPPSSIIDDSSTSGNKKKGSKSKPQSSDSSSAALFIDKDWVSEHARQVSRMLLGGMKVVGVYIWTKDSSFKNSTITLCQTIKGVADAVPFMDTDVDERLLIHISYSPRRWTCRNCSLASNITSTSLWPCDFKMGKVLTSLKEFRCTYNFDIRLPVCSESGSITKMREILRHRLSTHAKELKGAKCLIDGKLAIEDELYVPDGLHEVEFLLPFMLDKSLEAYSQRGVAGILVFHGSVCSFVYLNPKEPISQALDDIKEDIIMSLHSRLDILSDEADGDSESILDDHREASLSTGKQILQLDLQIQRQYSSLLFPQRVFVPWLAGTYICDYILPFETTEVLKDHCVELMSMEAPEDDSAILKLESGALILTSTRKSFWDIASHSSSDSKSDNLLSKNSRKARSPGTERKGAKLGDFNIVAVIVVLIISMVVGLVLFVFRS